MLRRKDMIPPQGWDLSSSQHAFTTGYPQSKVSIKVVLSFPMDGPLTQAQFASKVGMVPTTACMQILKDRLNMQVCLLGLSLSSATDADMEQDIDISPMLHTAGSDAAAGVGQSECRSLLGGRVPIADRTFYSNGDWKWGRGFQSALHALDETEYAKKMEVGSIYVDMSYVLARNRADGSNTYTNKRISSYGRWASLVLGVFLWLEPWGSRRMDSPSNAQECCDFYKEVIDKTEVCAPHRASASLPCDPLGGQNGLREGCPVYEALIALIKVLQRTNKEAWSLRPDNFYLFIQMIISDLMLSLNFHGSVVEVDPSPLFFWKLGLIERWGQGGENGIGSTLILHDGGGAYSTLKKNPIFTKNNGCGADFVISVLQVMTNISTLDPNVEAKDSDHFLQEVKRSSEMGLFLLTCNAVKGSDGEEEVVSRIREISLRLYTSEMRLHNDAMSASALQAILTSVSRQTRTRNPNMQTSTDNDTNKKVRVAIKYIQVIVGYFLICTNNLVGADNVERFSTLSRVTRSIPSCADAVDALTDDQNFTEHSLKYGKKRYVPSQQHNKVIQTVKCKGVFLSALSVAHFTAFMQWTGMLGKIPHSVVVEEILTCFYAQLELSKDILNPDKYCADNMSRCFEISKARNVPITLLATAIQSILSAGSTGGSLKEATKQCATRFTYKGGFSPSTLPWLMADTMEHLFRTDFLVLMQYFCKKLKVPTDLKFEEVLDYLRCSASPLLSPLHC